MRSLGITISRKNELELIRRHEAIIGNIGQQVSGYIRYKDALHDLLLNPYSEKWQIRTFE